MSQRKNKGASFVVVGMGGIQSNRVITSTSTFLKQGGFKQVGSFKEADFIVFTGGPDITPSIYGQSVAKETEQLDHARDVREAHIFGLLQHKKFLGICRGAQLLNVLNGGSLIQHDATRNHRRPHGFFHVPSGKYTNITSTHHQLMLPANPATTPRRILGLAYDPDRRAKNLNYVASGKKKQSIKTKYVPSVKESGKFLKQFQAPDFDPFSMDLEAVLYKNSLCIQGHPEYSKNTAFQRWTYEFIDSLLAA